MAVSGRKLDYPSKITDSRKVIRSRKSKMDIQKKEGTISKRKNIQRTNNDLQKTTQKIIE